MVPGSNIWLKLSHPQPRAISGRIPSSHPHLSRSSHVPPGVVTCGQLGSASCKAPGPRSPRGVGAESKAIPGGPKDRSRGSDSRRGSGSREDCILRLYYAGPSGHSKFGIDLCPFPGPPPNPSPDADSEGMGVGPQGLPPTRGSIPKDVFLRSRMIAPWHASLRSNRILHWDCVFSLQGKLPSTGIQCASAFL